MCDVGGAVVGAVSGRAGAGAEVLVEPGLVGVRAMPWFLELVASALELTLLLVQAVGLLLKLA